MARIRTIKPGFFRHEELFEAEKSSGFPLRLIFAGLWTVADREGRFEWKPRAIKLDVLPYDDIDFAAALEALSTHGFIVKYTAGGRTYAHIPSWSKHQQVNVREAKSEIPAPVEASASTCAHMPEPVQVRGEQEQEQEQEGKGTGGEIDAREQVLASPKTEPQPVFKSRKPRSETNRGTSWPPDAVVPDDWLAEAEAVLEMANKSRDVRVEALKFANYWAARAGEGGTKKDWKRTWLNWCLNDFGASKNGKANGQSRPTSVAGEVFGQLYADARAQREVAG